MEAIGQRQKNPEYLFEPTGPSQAAQLNGLFRARIRKTVH
jgi:hypothetical protein